jgi:hypothetical protein
VFSGRSLPIARLVWPGYRGFSGDGPAEYRGFSFRTYLAPGLATPDREVLKLDYDLPGNPGLSVRRVLDEVVALGDEHFLGKAFVRAWWGAWRLIAFFILIGPEE